MLEKGRGADKPGGWREREWDGCRERGRREGKRDSTVDSVIWGGKKRRGDRQKFDILNPLWSLSRVVFGR